MPSARVDSAPRRGLLRSLVVASAVASAALLSAVLPGAVAAADEPVGTTVVGELVQAWPESEDHEADGHEAEGAEQAVSWVETAEGETVPVVTADIDGLPAGSTVSVTVGEAVEQDAAGAGDEAHRVLDSELIAAPEAMPAPRGRFTNQVTVAMVAPAGMAPDARASRQRIVDLVDGPVADFWAAETGGAVSIGVTASHDWITTTAGCSQPAALWDEAAAKVGFVPGPGRHLLLYLPPNARHCAYALAEIGSGLTSGGRLYVTDLASSVIAHELGHNFGLAHSSGRQCDGAVDAGSCRTVGYRDYYDVMGISWAELGSLSVVQAAQLGVLPAADVQRVSVSGSAATVTLAPVSGRSGTRALRLTDAAGVDYWLEYRPAAARDAWLGSDGNAFKLDAGVLLRRADRFPDTSLLLDGTPSTTSGWDRDMQSALAVGTPVSLSDGQFTVVVRETSAAGAVVEVVPAAPATAVAPAPAPAAPEPGTVLPADGTAPAADDATPDAPAAPDAEPATPADPADAAAAARPTPVTGAAEPAQPSLAAAADSTDSSGGLVVVGAGTALAGAMTLVVRKLRRPVRR